MNNDQLYFYNRGFNDCLAKNLGSNPVKELTDEEICNLWVEHGYGQPLSNIAFEFARAILRKAQEK